jgi:hypothetical protein
MPKQACSFSACPAAGNTPRSPVLRIFDPDALVRLPRWPVMRHLVDYGFKNNHNMLHYRNGVSVSTIGTIMK